MRIHFGLRYGIAIILVMCLNAFSQTWTAQTSGTTATMYASSFVDANNGWISGTSGQLLHTTNGGLSWSSQATGATNTIYGLNFVDANSGWASGFNSIVYSTTNAGSLWLSQYSTLFAVKSQTFINANTGWIGGTGGNIYKTTDGCVSWVLQATGMLNICNSIRFIDNNNGWIAATAGKIVHTTNGGTTWTQQTSGVATSMLSVDFVDANNGWVVGASGVILHTTNAGATWTSQASGTTANLNCVRFTGSHTGWIVGNYGIILRTFDGGVNWETQVSATGTDATKNLNSVSMISACNGWAVGANGRVLHYTDTDWSQNQSNNSGPGNQSGWTPSFPNDPQTGNLPPIGIHFNPLSSGMNPSIVSVKNANRARSIAEWGLNGGEMSTAVPASNTIDRFWDVTQSGGSSMNAVLTLRFNATDVPVGMTNPLSQLQYAYFKHGVYPWTTLPVTSVTGPVNGVYTATVQNVADFSYWTLGGAPLALPVEMTSLSANSGDGRVQLTWRTESETGNDHFNIYRSTSRSDLGELVAQVNGHGTTAISHDYSYNDFRVSNQNRYFYRIADIDLNGTERLHSSIVEAYPTAEVRASIPIKYKLGQNFPNPFNPTTEISYGLKAAGNVYLLISDVQGRVITTLVNSYQTANTYRVVFDATGLPTGTYYYTLTTNGFTTTKKMVLMK